MAIGMQNKTGILNEVANYYSDKITQYGQTPRGVDWNGTDSQILRFMQLCKIIQGYEAFSLNDLGCGYSALYDFLAGQYSSFSYTGIDISNDMIKASMQRHIDSPNARFILSTTPDDIADYGIASGIFNVRLQHSDDEWIEYIKTTLDILNNSSRRGFSFNCLTSYSDAAKKRDYLYYASPCELFDFCRRRYSKQVALLHDYGLYEFTILVRKPE